MRTIAITSIEQFHSLSQRLFPSFVPAESASITWVFRLPEITGSVIDSVIAPESHVSRVRLQANQPFAFEVANHFDRRMAKLAWVRDGGVSCVVRGARTLYGATEGQMYLAAFEGDTRTRIEMNVGSRIDSLSAVLPLSSLQGLMAERSAAADGGPLFSHASHPSRHPFRFTTVIPERIGSALTTLLSGIDDEEQVAVPALAELMAGTVRVLDDANRWPSRVVSSADIDRVRRARSILLSRLDAPPTLRDLAHEVGLNEFKLKAGFRQAYGSTVRRELARARLETAREIIGRGNVSITTAASQVGYSNPGDFGIRFKKRFGVTPSEFRARRAS